MSLLNFAEFATAFRITEKRWRGFVLDNEDPSKQGGVRIFVPKIFDTGFYEGQSLEQYPWAFPESPESMKIPAINSEVGISFRNDDLYDIVYGPPVATDAFIPELRDRQLIMAWNNFIYMVQNWRTSGPQAPSINPTDDDENREPLVDPTLIWERTKDSEQSSNFPAYPAWEPPSLDFKEGKWLEENPVPEKPVHLQTEGYPNIELHGDGKSFLKVNRAQGSTAFFHGPSGIAGHADRYGNTIFSFKRLDINPAPRWGEKDERGKGVRFSPKRGIRKTNSGNFVSDDVFVNGYPVVLGGGGDSRFWFIREPELEEYPQSIRPKEVSPFVFKVVCSHVNGEIVPENRETIFEIAPNASMDYWLEIDLVARKPIRVRIETGTFEGPSQQYESNLDGDKVPILARYLLGYVKSDDEGIVDNPTYVGSPIALITYVSDVSSVGTFWEAAFFAG